MQSPRNSNGDEQTGMIWRRKQIAQVAERDVDEDLRAAFEGLAEAWWMATAHLSSPNKLMENARYRQIIGLGPAVLPLLLRDLAKTQRFWFPALSAITGQNPVPDDAAGDIRRMADAWIEWGRQNGLTEYGVAEVFLKRPR